MDAHPSHQSPLSVGSPPDPGAAAAGNLLRPALLLWLVTQVALGLYVQAMAFLWRPEMDPDTYLMIWEVGYLLICGVVLWFVWPDPDARRVFARPRPRMVELCLLVGVLTALLLSMWENQIPSAWSKGSPIVFEKEAGWPVWASLIASSVAPALFEEWMYRGLLLQRFRRVLSPALAVAVQAMLFAVMHRDEVMLLPHFVFGIVAGVLRIAAGSLWPCMLMHLLWNAHIVLLVYGLL